MAKQTPSRLIRSRSYHNLLYAHLDDHPFYATCPPLHTESLCSSLSIRSNSQTTTSSMRTSNFQPGWRLSCIRQGLDDEQQQAKQQQQQRCVYRDKRRKQRKQQIPVKQAAIIKRGKDDTKDDTSMEHSSPIFEILPQLVIPDIDAQHRVLYENALFVDGIKHDYKTGKSTERLNANGKVNVDFKKFLKSITSAKKKPSDSQIIFGNAKLLLAKKCDWQNSRLDWLHKLEQHNAMQEELINKRRLLGDFDDDANDNNVHICCLPFNANILSWHVK